MRKPQVVLPKISLRISVLGKLIISYVILIVVLASVIGFTSFSISASNYKNQVIAHNRKLLENYATFIDSTVINKIKELHNNICLNIGISVNIDTYFKGLIDMGKLRTLSLELSTLAASSDMVIEAVHTYVKEKEYFLSSKMGLKINNDINKYYWPNLLWVVEVDENTSNSVWLPTRRVNYSQEQGVNIISYVSTYPANASSFSEARGYIAIDIREDYIKNVLSETSRKGAGQLFLMDSSNSIIACNGPFGVSIMNEPLLSYKNIINGQDSIFTLGGEKYIVNYHPLNNGWIIVRAVPVDEFYSVSRDIAVKILMISVGAVIVSFAIARVFASKLYYPLKMIILRIRNLISISSMEDGKVKNDEYTLIDNALTEFNTRMLHLSRNWEDNIPNLKQNLLHNIISDTFESKQAFIKYIRQIGIPFINEKYNIFLLHLINQALGSTEDSELVKRLILYIEGMSNESTVFVASRISSSVIAVLVMSQDESIDGIENIISYAGDTLMVDVSASIGTWQQSPQDCHVSYREAVEAYKYRYFMPDENIFDFADISCKNPDQNSVNEFEIIYARYHKCLVNGDTKEAHNTIYEFVKKIVTSEFSYDYREKCLEEMANVLIAYSKETLIDSKNLILEKRYPRDMLTNIHEYESWIVQATTHVLELKESKSTSMIDDIISNIKRYIKDHLSEDLSLTRLSEYTTLSNSYLSHLFKETTGISLVDYITNKRMQRAKELLETTNLNISEIAEASGYYTAHYFSKKFKQYYGISPRQYRIACNSMECIDEQAQPLNRPNR